METIEISNASALKIREILNRIERGRRNDIKLCNLVRLARIELLKAERVSRKTNNITKFENHGTDKNI